jgi:D-glycero-D-manno-heptose 1,7-bisphosphate phosphatase
MQAAYAAGGQPHLLLVGKSAQYTRDNLPPDLPPNTTVHSDLHAFADYVLNPSKV